MKTNVRFSIFMLAVLLCLGCFAGCKKEPEQPPATTEELGTAAPGIFDVPDYNYPELNCEGEGITICGLSSLWDMYIALDAPNTGDKLDRAVYRRNAAIEKQFNCVIEVDEFQWNYVMGDYLFKIETAISSDMCPWDIIFLPLNEQPDLITRGYFKDLNTINELQLDSAWWDGVLNKELELSGKLFSASTPMQLQAYDSSWAMFYNETLFTNYGVQSPRALFDKNEWTLAKMGELCQQGANLNGSDSFIYAEGNGQQIYGLSAHPLLPDKLLFAAGERYVVKNESTGVPEFCADKENFLTVVKDLADILGKENNLRAASEDMIDYIVPTGYGATCGYVYAFVNSHAFLMGAEIKTARVIKTQDVEVSYGVVPLPKKDSSQADYQTPIVETLLTFAIPTRCDNVEMVAKIADVMSYESYKSVLPEYYDTLLYRGYTEADEPIIKILVDSRGVDMAYYYDWNGNLADHVQERIFAGSGDISSKLASEKEAIQTSIQKWIVSFSKLDAPAA